MAAGCASSLLRGTPNNVEETYNNAMQDLKDGYYPEAISGFTDVKTKYPYTKYAALADLRIADTHFERGKFLEAIDAYRSFLKMHPNHAELPYAMLRIGEAYYEQIPSDWWLLPPSHEKDQGNTRAAIAAYRDLLARYPASKEAESARGRLDDCRRRLADHEMYVARFYFKRERYKAAAERAEGLVRDYPSLGFDEEALWLMAQSRFELGEVEPARAAATRLAKDFPNGSYSSAARRLLDELGAAGGG
ncbi:MAG: outer membrane protein assembly factor BamD [Deltaproteobacteria bacterium]|nr:outer membrane protein assembly factor BamD [Deltaproteobacteria bacterium]